MNVFLLNLPTNAGGRGGVRTDGGEDHLHQDRLVVGRGQWRRVGDIGRDWSQLREAQVPLQVLAGSSLQSLRPWSAVDHPEASSCAANLTRTLTPPPRGHYPLHFVHEHFILSIFRVPLVVLYLKSPYKRHIISSSQKTTVFGNLFNPYGLF